MEHECKEHSGITKAVDNLEKSDEQQWEEINGLKKMLSKYVPAWVTLILMVMSGITGSALTFAGMIIKFAGSK